MKETSQSVTQGTTEISGPEEAKHSLSCQTKNLQWFSHLAKDIENMYTVDQKQWNVV